MEVRILQSQKLCFHELLRSLDGESDIVGVIDAKNDLEAPGRAAAKVL